MNIEDFARHDKEVPVKSITVVPRFVNVAQIRRWTHRHDEFFTSLGKNVRTSCPYAAHRLARSGLKGLHAAMDAVSEPGMARAWEDFEALWDERHQPTVAINCNMICAPVGMHSSPFSYRYPSLATASNLKMGASSEDLREDLKVFAQLCSESCVDVVLWSGSVWDKKAEVMQAYTVAHGMVIPSFPGSIGIASDDSHKKARETYEDVLVGETSDPVNRRYVGSVMRNDVDYFWVEELRPFINEVREDPAFAPIAMRLAAVGQ